MADDQFGDEHFAVFAASLEGLLASHDMPDRKRRDAHQRGQIEGLIAAEVAFRKALQRQRVGARVYAGFIDHIRKERRNILAARPFFRERNLVFKNHISGALASGKPEALYPFGINAVFIQFVLSRYRRWFNPNGPVLKTAARILKLRSDIIEQNLPLAISRAKLFYAKTPKSPHMDRMDIVQVSSEGLISAVDKFVLPWTPKFRAVVIGRSTGNMISNYSEPLLHFFPGDRRKIYQANKARRVTQEVDKLTQIVNSQLPMELQTDTDEIQQLMNASSHLSLDQPLAAKGGGGETSTYADFTVDNQVLSDQLVEQHDLHNKLGAAVGGLSLFERKALALRGLLSEGNL